MYEPLPVDTSEVALPEELTALVEDLARNVHDVWARTRIDDGWSYGPERDDSRKTSPCLVPYDELPESEKEYDRNTALETVKLIVGMGYTIRKASASASVGRFS